MEDQSVERTRRDAIEGSLDRLVEDNRFTIAVVFPVIGAITLIASAEGLLPQALAFNPLLILFGVAVLRLPLISGLLPLVTRRALVALSVLVAYTYAIEYIGATTGWPYGEFSYQVALGPMIGPIPLALPLFFIPLVINSYLLCLLLLGNRHLLVRLVMVSATVVTVDLVLDPAAVALGFWVFAESGFYGVPYSNFAGWILSAFVGVAVIDLAFDRQELRARVTRCSYILDDMVSFVLLWGVINAFYRAWIPVAIAMGFGLALRKLDRFDFDVRPSWSL